MCSIDLSSFPLVPRPSVHTTLGLLQPCSAPSLSHHCLLGDTGSPAGPSSRSRWTTLPQVTRDGEGIYAHAHGFGWDGAELLPVRTVLVDGLDLRGADGPRADPGQTHQLLGFWIHGVNTPELAAGVTEEDEEVVGRTFLHLLEV